MLQVETPDVGAPDELQVRRGFLSGPRHHSRRTRLPRAASRREVIAQPPPELACPARWARGFAAAAPGMRSDLRMQC